MTKQSRDYTTTCQRKLASRSQFSLGCVKKNTEYRAPCQSLAMTVGVRLTPCLKITNKLGSGIRLIKSMTYALPPPPKNDEQTNEHQIPFYKQQDNQHNLLLWDSATFTLRLLPRIAYAEARI